MGLGGVLLPSADRYGDTPGLSSLELQVRENALYFWGAGSQIWPQP